MPYGMPYWYASPIHFPAGARCRVCATVYSQTETFPVDRCPAHAQEQTSDEALLGNAAVYLQDFGFWRFTEVRRSMGWWPCTVFLPLHPLSQANMWWHEMTVQNYMMCEHSLYELSPLWMLWLSGMYFHQWAFPAIIDVVEMKFMTDDQNGPIKHCAFRVRMQSGDYVFDPTGVQFGPVWPLVSRYDDYVHKRMHPNPATRDIQCAALGTNRVYSF